jgi:hypothetical protein
LMLCLPLQLNVKTIRDATFASICRP